MGSMGVKADNVASPWVAVHWCFHGQCTHADNLLLPGRGADTVHSMQALYASSRSLKQMAVYNRAAAFVKCGICLCI